MITESFDNTTAPVIAPENFYQERQQICGTCIATFSKVIFNHALHTFPHRQIATIQAANGSRPIYLLETEGKEYVFYLSGIGATLAATDVIEVNWLTGATKFILFGSAGSLNRGATQGKYVIPTEAYRDEGMSYHYAPPSDYIRIPMSDRTASLFEQMKLPFVKGRVWTTDAIYRETRGLVGKRQEEGCIAVEMELAGVQAVCDYHGLELYDFLVTGDVLDMPVYDAGGLPGANHQLDKFYVALGIARMIS